MGPHHPMVRQPTPRGRLSLTLIMPGADASWLMSVPAGVVTRCSNIIKNQLTYITSAIYSKQYIS